jgi:hypothetical protein
MGTIFILFALIVALIGLVGVRKENEEAELNKIIAKYKLEDIEEELEDIEEELRLEQKSNASNQGWNTKYRKTIEKMKVSEENTIKIYEEHTEELEEKNKDQADTIKRLNCSLDESHIVVEAIANNTNKRGRLQLANKYKFNEK